MRGTLFAICGSGANTDIGCPFAAMHLAMACIMMNTFAGRYESQERLITHESELCNLQTSVSGRLGNQMQQVGLQHEQIPRDSVLAHTERQLDARGNGRQPSLREKQKPGMLLP